MRPIPHLVFDQTREANVTVRSHGDVFSFVGGEDPFILICDGCVQGATMSMGGMLIDIRWANLDTPDELELLLVDRESGNLVRLDLSDRKSPFFSVTGERFEDPNNPNDDLAVRVGLIIS